MQHNPPIMDYEPVTRSGNTDVQSDESVSHGFDKRSSSREPRVPESDRIEAPPHSEGTQESEEKKSILKRGHAVSFGGLFLFTFVIYFRPQEFYPSLFFLRNIAFWIALSTLVVYLPTQLGLNGRPSVKQREVTCLVFLAMVALLSIPQALDPSWAWSSFVDYLKVVVMFIVMVNVVRTEKRLKALILLALFASCVMSIGAVNDYRMGRLLQNKIRIEGIIGGLFSNANDLALHLVTMIALAMGLLMGSKGLLKKLVYLACAILFVSAVVATYSRGGFIALGCVIGVFAWKLARRHRVLFAAGGLSLVLLLVLLGPGGYRERLTQGQDSSTISRTDELKRSVFLMVRHPLLGLGINNYILFSNTSHASHNAYTQVGSEMGIPAMLVYIVFLVTPIKRLERIRRNGAGQPRGRLYYLRLGIEASLIGYMVASFFLSVAYLWYGYYLVAYAIAVSRLPDEPGGAPPVAAEIKRTVSGRSIILEPHQ